MFEAYKDDDEASYIQEILNMKLFCSKEETSRIFPDEIAIR